MAAAANDVAVVDITRVKVIFRRVRWRSGAPNVTVLARWVLINYEGRESEAFPVPLAPLRTTDRTAWRRPSNLIGPHRRRRFEISLEPGITP